MIHFKDTSLIKADFFFDNFDEFTIKEKIDGSNFLFKLSKDKTEVNRKGKTPAYFSPSDWPQEIWTNNFRAAHTFIDEVKKSLILENELIINSEIICNGQSNTIEYDDSLNRIIVYSSNHERFDPIIKQIKVNSFKTLDGISIFQETELQTWKIEFMDSLTLEFKNWQKEFNAPWANFVYLFQEFYQNNETKQFAIEQIKFINSFILNSYVKNKQSFIKKEGSDFSIEGIVLSHKEKPYFKIIDTEFFTKLNKFNYTIRNSLTKSPFNRLNSLMDRYHLGELNKDGALGELEEKRQDYFNYWKDLSIELNDKTIKINDKIHMRNLETFASIRKQLKEI